MCFFFVLEVLVIFWILIYFIIWIFFLEEVNFWLNFLSVGFYFVFIVVIVFEEDWF